MSNQVEHRPLLVALIALAIGLTSKDAVLALLLLIPLCALLRSVRSLGLVVTFLAVGYFAAPAPLPLLASPQLLPGPAVVTAEGEDRPDSVQALTSVSGFRLVLAAPPGTTLHIGERLQGPFLAKPISESAEAYSRSQGIQGRIRVEKLRVLTPPLAIFSFPDSFRNGFRTFVASSASADNARWIDSLWFRAGELTSTEKAELASSGAYGIVAASGLQIFVLWALLSFILGSLLQLSRAVQIGALAVALTVYCVATGLHEGAIRAGFSCLALSTAYLFKREPDLISATSFTAILYLLLNPWALNTLGFQLSTVVPIVLGMSIPTIRFMCAKVKGNLARRAVQAVVGTGFVTLAAEPLVAFHTGSFSLGLPVTGLLLGLIAPALLGSALVAYLLGALLPQAGVGLVRVLVEPATSGFRTAVSGFATAIPPFAIPLFSPIVLFIYYGLWLALWREIEIPA